VAFNTTTLAHCDAVREGGNHSIYLDSGQLHLVADAPRFPYPAWVVWRDDVADDLKQTAQACLQMVLDGTKADGEAVLNRLKGIGSTEVIGL